MKKVFVFLVLFSVVALSGCLSEKKFDSAKVSVAPVLPLPSDVLPVPSAQASGLPSAGVSPSSPLPSAFSGPAACDIVTPRNSSSFASGESVPLFIIFVGLPSQVTTASINCDAGDSPSIVDLSRSGNSVVARKSCIYSPSASKSVKISVSAGAAECGRTLSIAVPLPTA